MAPQSGLDWEGKTHPALNLEEASAKLRAEETSDIWSAVSGTSVTRYDALKVATEIPCQDNLAYEVIRLANEKELQFWGVYDGHAGWACSEVLRRSLISYVAREIDQAYMKDTADEQAIDSAIKTAFLRLDEEIITSAFEAINSTNPRAEVLSHLAPAVSGSCALVAILDPSTSVLRIACAGDSKAVLGRAQAGKWSAIALSEESTPKNEGERDRVLAAHPDEPKLISASGRMLGLPLTRSFGDHRWKWPVEAIQKGRDRFFANPPRPDYHTPPYLTAEPTIKNIKVQPRDFLILASDGMWDNISNDDAVTCVELWVDETKRRAER